MTARQIIGTDIVALPFLADGASVARDLGDRFADVRSVFDFGARGNGVTDDSAAIQAALNAASAAGGGLVLLPSATFYVASTIVVPASVTLEGINFAPGNPARGSIIMGAASLSPVVQLGTVGVNSTQSLRKLTVTRVSGTPSTSLIGILVQDGYNVILEDFFSVNHGIGVKFSSTAADSSGLGAKIWGGYVSCSTDAHVVIDTWPELYWFGGRFGQNGLGDYATNAHVRVLGGLAGTAGGPNTIKFEAVHFNHGNTAAVHLWEFVNLSAGGLASIDARIFNLTDCHIENFSGAYFYSDSTWDQIDRVFIKGCTFNTPIPAFALNAATSIGAVNLTDNHWATTTFNLAPTNGFVFLNIAGGTILGTISLTGATAGDYITMTGVSLGGNRTIAGTFQAFTSQGCVHTGGSTTSTATGRVHFFDGLLPATISTGSSDSNAIIITGNCTSDANQGSQIKIVNSNAGSGVRNKFMRVSSTGTFDLISSNYGTTLLSFTDAGVMTLGGSISGPSISSPTITTAATFQCSPLLANNQSLMWNDNVGSPAAVLGKLNDNNIYFDNVTSGGVFFVRTSGFATQMTVAATGVTFANAITGNAAVLSNSATAGVGYATGAGGTVTQASSRTTGVTLNKTTGAITLVSAAGSASYQTFTVTNSAVAATDIIHLSQKSGTDKYILLVTAVAAGSFNITFATTGGTTTEQPVINFAVIKGVTS